MSDSSPADPEPRPPLSGRGLGRRRLLAIGVAAPVAFAIAKASDTRTASGAPPLADTANRSADSHTGTAHYFC